MCGTAFDCTRDGCGSILTRGFFFHFHAFIVFDSAIRCHKNGAVRREWSDLTLVKKKYNFKVFVVQ